MYLRKASPSRGRSVLSFASRSSIAIFPSLKRKAGPDRAAQHIVNIQEDIMMIQPVDVKENSRDISLQDGDANRVFDDFAFVDFDESAFTEAIKSCRRDSLNLQKYQGHRLGQQQGIKNE